jgi:hypothetical protein
MKWTFCRVCDFYAVARFKGAGGGAQRIITDDMREEAKIATEEWNRYVSDHLPMEQKFIAAKTKGTEVQQSGLRGQVNADIAQAAKGGLTIPAGADPSQSFMKQAGAMTSLAKTTAGALTDVTQKAQDREIQDLGTVVAMGRGQAVEAQGGISGLAESSAASALTKARSEQQARFAEEQGQAKLIGSGLNAAMAGLTYGMGKSALTDVQQGAGGFTDGRTGVTGGSYAGRDLYAGDLW